MAVGTVFNDIGAVLALRGRQPGWQTGAPSSQA
jgi:hypothetical protein